MQQTALNIVKTLQAAGYTAYYAGGCVRDRLLGKEPEDIDIVTSALPGAIEELLEKTVPVGKEFGVIRVLEGGHEFEVATFRSDSALSDGRRPDAVFFTNPSEDARRRDFTINGLFYDPVTDQVMDYVGGQADLKARLIRFIGDPRERIREDYLRILRAVRFKLRLGFDYALETEADLLGAAADVTRPAWERIADELGKLLSPADVIYTYDQVFDELSRLGFLPHLLPEVEALKKVPQPPQYHAEGDVYTHTMRCLRALHPSTEAPVIWAVLLHDVGKQATLQGEGESIHFHGHEMAGVEIAQAILARLRMSRVDRDRILWLIRHHMMLLSFDKMRPGRRLRWFMHPWFEDLLTVFMADAAGTSPTDLTEVNRIRTWWQEEKDMKLLEPPKWLVTGKDLIEVFGLEPSQELGDLLDLVHDEQLSGEVKTRDQALSFAKELLGEWKRGRVQDEVIADPYTDC